MSDPFLARVHANTHPAVVKHKLLCCSISTYSQVSHSAHESQGWLHCGQQPNSVPNGILDCYLKPYIVKEGEDPVSELMIADLITSIEPLFIFAVVWSIGATTNSEGRARFDGWLRAEMYSNSAWCFPKEGYCYDYMFSWESKKWIRWMDIIDKYEIDPKLSFSEIVVPTQDVRNTYLMDLLLNCEKHVLMVGATGTGKTINISQYLMGQSPKVEVEVFLRQSSHSRSPSPRTLARIWCRTSSIAKWTSVRRASMGLQLVKILRLRR